MESYTEVPRNYGTVSRHEHHIPVQSPIPHDELPFETIGHVHALLIGQALLFLEIGPALDFVSEKLVHMLRYAQNTLQELSQDPVIVSVFFINQLSTSHGLSG